MRLTRLSSLHYEVALHTARLYPIGQGKGWEGGEDVKSLVDMLGSFEIRSFTS